MGSSGEKRRNGVKTCVQYGGKNIRNVYSTFFVFSLLLTVFVLRVLLSSYVFLLYLMCICCTMCVLLSLLYMPDCWLEVSIRKVLRSATSTQVFLGFPVSTSEC